MKDKRYPCLARKGEWMEKLKEASRKGLCGLTLLACVGLAPRCGGVMEGHPARNAKLSKAHARLDAASARQADEAESAAAVQPSESTGL